MDYELIFRREHPHCRRNRRIWERSKAAYSGGAAYVEMALVRHVSEIDLEFEERKLRAAYFNYPRKIARLITQYAFSTPPERRDADWSMVEDFSRTGLRANEVMCQFSTLLNVYGSAFVAVEMPSFEGEATLLRKSREKLRPYAVALSPLAVPDYAYGDDGELLWAILEERHTLDSDPFRRPEVRRRRRLLTRTGWMVFEQDKHTGKTVLVGSGDHNLGAVPLLRSEEPDGFGIEANHWFEDVVRISDAILNNESEAQMNIIKQMFGLLVISENFARKAETRKLPAVGSGDPSGEKFSRVLARSAAIWESCDEKGVSRYIAPSGVESEQIREENQMLKREMFDVVGLSIQRESRVGQTAESKAWDFQSVRQYLASRVELLEQTEVAIWKLMHRFDPTIPVPQVLYNRDFDVVDLQSSIAGLLALNGISGGAGYRSAVGKAAVNMLEKLQHIPGDERARILREMEAEGASDDPEN